MRAGAFIVGPRDGTGAALLELARAVGFQSVARYRTIEAAERQLEATPLVFFLFAGTPRVSRLKHTTSAIRYASNPRLRFAPMIYLAATVSRPDIESCVAMGFDDVISLPFPHGDLGARLFRQVGRATTYFETATYFGPDRRTQFGTIADQRRTARPGPHKRYDVLRTPELGVTVMQAAEIGGTTSVAATEMPGDAFLL